MGRDETRRDEKRQDETRALPFAHFTTNLPSDFNLFPQDAIEKGNQLSAWEKEAQSSLVLTGLTRDPCPSPWRAGTGHQVCSAWRQLQWPSRLEPHPPAPKRWLHHQCLEPTHVPMKV